MSKISIIVPIYNAEKVLHKTIISIQKQTLKDIEIILVNDGSTDNSLAICKIYANDDNRIKIISKENAGVSSARNVGIKAATGKYIGFVDAGDWIEPNMYEEMYNKAEDLRADIAMCNYIIHKKNVEKHISININSSFVSGKDIINNIVGNMILSSKLKNREPIMGSVWRLLIKKDLIIKHNIEFEEKLDLMEDLIFCIEIFFRANLVSISKEFYYHYILEPVSLSTCYRKDMLTIRKNVYESIKKILIRENAFIQLKNNMIDRYINIYIGAISNEFRSGNNKKMKEKIKTIKEICSDSELNNILKNINTSEYSFNKKLVINAIKFKIWIFLYFYYSIINKFL